MSGDNTIEWESRGPDSAGWNIFNIVLYWIIPEIIELREGITIPA